MPSRRPSSLVRTVLGSVFLFLVLAAIGAGLWLWKRSQQQAAAAAAANQPEWSVAIEAAPVGTRAYTKTSTTIGTVRALRSITLRNELPGTVRAVHLTTGQVVAAGDLLVELDVAVEQAQLAALQAEARLAETMLGRMERALESQGASAADVDRARAERDMAVANVQRLQALIEQKRLRAPFAARTGLVDLHEGQYLEPGTTITTLQGIDDAVHVDFSVTQDVATRLQTGRTVELVTAPGAAPVPATIAAIDARVDAATRNTWIRAELRGAQPLPQPGASVRVRVPVTAPRDVAVVPVSALRRGPAGTTVFVVQPDPQQQLRAHERRVASGAVLGDDVVIESGLEVGENVATTGSFKLREGVLVALPQAPASAKPN
ncbi:MAG: efflux RND transporter periplasmic adaptor subunit [Planctomycetes bacterium]|nr:efflux RND transporter periplasmic adaptor subunit [Planctomycetota bacterium]